jgi:hypothetical protein
LACGTSWRVERRSIEGQEGRGDLHAAQGGAGLRPPRRPGIPLRAGWQAAANLQRLLGRQRRPAPRRDLVGTLAGRQPRRPYGRTHRTTGLRHRPGSGWPREPGRAGAGGAPAPQNGEDSHRRRGCARLLYVPDGRGGAQQRREIGTGVRREGRGWVRRRAAEPHVGRLRVARQDSPRPTVLAAPVFEETVGRVGRGEAILTDRTGRPRTRGR